jgi:hypothetical protein
MLLPIFLMPIMADLGGHVQYRRGENAIVMGVIW